MRAPTRRDALRLLGMTPFALAAQADPLPPIRDQGIGGTGARPNPVPGDATDETGDRGIGGTGVIGTIRRFGSIVVNDLRISYPKDVAVRIDGAPASVSDLKIGHVVRVVARTDGSGLSTRRIDVLSEVVGPVEAIGEGTGRTKGAMTVLGQRVVMPAGPVARWKPGDRVAVSGLRRPDGVVVASLIEARGAGSAQVTGPIRRSAAGAPMIGNLTLDGIDGDRIGQRVTVTGEARGSALAVAQVDAERALFVPGLRRVSIEAYVGRNARGLNLGAGFDVAGAPNPDLPRRGSVRAVVTAEAGRDGRLTVERLQIDPRSNRPALPDGETRGGTPRLDGLRPEGTRPGAGAGAPQRFDIDTRSPPGASGFGGGHGGERGGGFGGAPGGPGGGFERPGGPGRGPGGFGGPGGGFGGGGNPGGGPGGR